ncbi:MAG TPA: hypothetical protein IAB66_09050 [Candidatus Caccousia avistercoris]|nr:hypothetical protein [Candidatus Caccousia avistercoris]
MIRQRLPQQLCGAAIEYFHIVTANLSQDDAEKVILHFIVNLIVLLKDMSSKYYNTDKLTEYVSKIIYKTEYLDLSFEDKKQIYQLYEDYKSYMNDPHISENDE